MCGMCERHADDYPHDDSEDWDLGWYEGDEPEVCETCDNTGLYVEEVVRGDPNYFNYPRRFEETRICDQCDKGREWKELLDT